MTRECRPREKSQFHSVAASGRDEELERRVLRNVEPRTGRSAALSWGSAPWLERRT